MQTAFPRLRPTAIKLTLPDIHNYYPATPPPTLVPHFFAPSKYVPILLDLSAADRGPLAFTTGPEPINFNVLPVKEATRDMWALLLRRMDQMRGHEMALKVLEIGQAVTEEARVQVAIRLQDGKVIMASDWGAADLLARLNRSAVIRAAGPTAVGGAGAGGGA